MTLFIHNLFTVYVRFFLLRGLAVYTEFLVLFLLGSDQEIVRLRGKTKH